MSADGIAVVTIAFPDPTFDADNNIFTQVDPSISFQDPISNSIRTLSTNEAASGADITGLLYVPDLSTDACVNASQPYVPANATRRSALPHNDYSLVAFAPWFSPECTIEYLASTKNTPTHAFIFYQPQTNSSDVPPLVSDPSWGLGDGGSWKKSNKFPVYAIPAFHGNLIMTQLNLYSKNVTEVPHGHDLAAEYPASDYIRLWTQISTSDRSKLPSLWVFLLITLGLLVIIIGGTSFTMHFLQRRRRLSLQRRIANGEVDLEALGIKRLTVPQEILEKMPVHVYTAKGSTEEPSPSTFGNASSTTARPPDSYPAFSQSTCPICLDDFIPNETPVRELPCRHIFHPECVDAFLLNNSSLCPMCKHSTLPKGYCPALITNAMVRRERMVRRARQRRPNGPARSTTAASTVSGLTLMSQRPPPTERHRLYREAFAEAILGHNFGRSRPNAPPEATQAPASDLQPSAGDHPNGEQHNENIDIELGSRLPSSIPTAHVPPAAAGDELSSHPRPSAHLVAEDAPCATHSPASVTLHSRSEWARERAATIMGSRRPVVDADEEEQGRPLWRRAFSKVWPGLV